MYFLINVPSGNFYIKSPIGYTVFYNARNKSAMSYLECSIKLTSLVGFDLRDKLLYPSFCFKNFKIFVK